MKQPKPTTIDFETFGIEGRPKYPPMPVGVSIKYWGKKSIYYAFGHLVGNNCCWSDAKLALEKAYKTPEGILFQNAKFDIDVAEEWFGLEPPPWDKIHDTMFLLFLDDPHQASLELKPSAERLLGWAPEEQDKLCDWLVEHQPVVGIKISPAKRSPFYYGRYIAFAPAKIVGKYAMGDTDRTYALYKMLWRKTRDRHMIRAYDRERELMPILLETEKQGLPVDLKKLKSDVAMYSSWRVKIDNWVYKRLKVKEPFNINSGPQLMKAMINAGKVDETKALLTPTGKLQTNKDALLLAVNDKTLLAILTYRARLNTCLNTFMSPWLKTALTSNGLIFTSWNQVRLPSGGSTKGTRTGRLSSTPNFQNIPNPFKSLFKSSDDKSLPKCPWPDLPKLPRCRSYIIPFKGDVFIDRDYSQQEPRILAHFEGFDLLQMYLDNPWVDVHNHAKAELEKMGLFFERKPVKNTNLGIIYGMGVAKLAMKNNMTVKNSKILKDAILKLYSGIKELYKDMKVRAANHEPIRTWGGREYYCEEPSIVNGRLQEWDYKMVNQLIQGSAADCTKEAIIRFHKRKKKDWKIVLNVHDQITSSVPKKDKVVSMEVLRVEMEGIEFDVPMLTEGSWSADNWEDLKDYDKKGELLNAA